MRLFVLACVLLGGMGQGVVSPRMPEILGDSPSLAWNSGLSATLMYLGIFAATFVYGRAADRGRVHWLLSPGLLAYAIILIALGRVAGASPALFLFRFLEGLAIAAIYVAADFALGRLSSESERGKWLSFYGVALSIGLILGPLLSLAMPRLATFAGITPSLAHAPALPLDLVALLAFGLAAKARNYRVPALAEADRDSAPLDARPLLSGAAYGFMEASLVAVFPALAVHELHVPPENCLLVTILSAAAFSFPWGWLGDRAGARPTTVALLGLLALGPAALALTLAPGSAGDFRRAYASCILFGIIAGGLYPVGFSWLLAGTPESRYGQASGAFARAYGAGSLLGPLTAGFFADRAGFSGLMASVSAAGLLTLLAIFGVGRGLRGSPRKPTPT